MRAKKRETYKSYKLKPGLCLLKNILFHRLIIKLKFKKEKNKPTFSGNSHHQCHLSNGISLRLYNIKCLKLSYYL